MKANLNTYKDLNYEKFLTLKEAFYNEKVKKGESITDTEALHVLIDYLLGPNFYIEGTGGNDQVNTIIVYEIMEQYKEVNDAFPKTLKEKICTIFKVWKRL